MNVHVLIPSRLASSRLPNKPLAEIAGKPMIVRCWEQAMKANVGTVTVVAGDAEIVSVAQKHGADAILTEADLPSGSDRIWQGLQKLMEKGSPKPDIVINVQGDEPLLPPEMLMESVDIFMKNPEVDVVTFAHWIEKQEDLTNPNLVKLVTDEKGRALYFSRSGIPYNAQKMKRHIGFYAYRYNALEKFVTASPSYLEKQEKLEQLRGLEMGLHYHVAITNSAPIGVDTQEDLIKVQQMFKQ